MTLNTTRSKYPIYVSLVSQSQISVLSVLRPAIFELHAFLQTNGVALKNRSLDRYLIIDTFRNILFTNISRKKLKKKMKNEFFFKDWQHHHRNHCNSFYNAYDH